MHSWIQHCKSTVSDFYKSSPSLTSFKSSLVNESNSKKQKTETSCNEDLDKAVYTWFILVYFMSICFDYSKFLIIWTTLGPKGADNRGSTVPRLLEDLRFCFPWRLLVIGRLMVFKEAWIESYLTDWKQQGILNSFKPAWNVVLGGIPQGLDHCYISSMLMTFLYMWIITFIGLQVITNFMLEFLTLLITIAFSQI